MRRSLIAVLFISILFSLLVGCTPDADVASRNLSQEADNFRILRRAIFYNGITGEYMLSIDGFLSIEDQGNQLEVTVKIGDGQYKKHFLGLSDNVTYFVEQLDSANVSTSFYRVTFKPSVIIPDIEAR